MVERLLRALGKETSGLHEAAFLLATFALASQVMGLIRDRLLAARYGAGTELDVYYAAFRVPDFLYASVASFVAVTVLIPFILERMESGGGTRAARDFVSAVATGFAVAISLACAVAFVAMPALAGRLVPGFDAPMREEFILLSRILLLSPLLLGFSNLFGAVTQSLRRFMVFALGPLLYNAGILLGIFFLLPSYGLTGVVLGVVLGALMHVGIQLPVLFREGMLPRPSFSFGRERLFDVVTLSVPRTLALSAANIAGAILIAFASRIEAGAIAVYTLAMNLQNVPHTIVGMSYSVAAFPTLAKLWTEGEREQFRTQIVTASRHIIFWSFPAIVLFIVLRAQIVRTILGSGAFDWTATRLTAAALALFAVSIVAQNFVLLLTRASYAMGRTRDPLLANLFGAIGIIIFALFLLSAFAANDVFRFFSESLLRVSDIPGTSVLMLPLAFSLGMIANSLALLYLVERRIPGIVWELRRPTLHAFSASIVMGFVAYHGLQVFAPLFDLDTLLGIFSQGFLAGFIGIIAGVFLLRLLENVELREISLSLHRKFWKTRPIAAEQEGL